MIDIWLRFRIVEKCVELIFDGIMRNFRILDLRIHNYNLGDCCHIRLNVDGSSLLLERCKVIAKFEGQITLICEDYEEPFFMLVQNGEIKQLFGNQTPIRNWFQEFVE